MSYKFTAEFRAVLASCFVVILNGCTHTSEVMSPEPHVNPSFTETEYINNDDVAIEKTPLVKTNVEPVLEDVWSHIRSTESLGSLEHKTVQTQLNKFKNNQHFFDVMGARSEPFIYHITNELEKRGMPLYLALLPIVESGYQTDVVSSWKAAGLWQIIPSTGKYLKLKQNWWYDGRRDAINSTRAALDYLEELHDRFGDWQLTLAAYNSGGATVSKAMRKNTRNGRPTDFWSLDLPLETRLYIPKLIALASVIDTPEPYGVELPYIPYEPYLTVVDTKQQIQLKKASELSGVDIEELKNLNAGFKRWATDPDGPHHLVVPADSAQRLELAIATLPDNERVKWQHHKIKSGESLWTIARKYEISINLLKRANHLTSERLRIGKNLMIPAGSFPESIVSNAPDTTPKIPVLKNNKYRIKSGDSLWIIARRFDIHVQQILDWNGIEKDQALKPGSELTILLEQPPLEAAKL